MDECLKNEQGLKLFQRVWNDESGDESQERARDSLKKMIEGDRYFDPRIEGVPEHLSSRLHVLLVDIVR